MFTAFSGHPASVHGGVHGPTVLAAALSLSLTGALMVLFKVSHPPAGATTLIVSLGIIALPRDLLVMEAAVIPLTLQAFVLNRLAGMPYPLWHSTHRREWKASPIDSPGLRRLGLSSFS